MFELFSRMAKRPTLTKLDDDGETQMDMYIDMPGSTATGDYWNPPDSEACCGGTY